MFPNPHIDLNNTCRVDQYSIRINEIDIINAFQQSEINYFKDFGNNLDTFLKSTKQKNETKAPNLKRKRTLQDNNSPLSLLETTKKRKQLQPTQSLSKQSQPKRSKQKPNSAKQHPSQASKRASEKNKNKNKNKK